MATLRLKIKKNQLVRKVDGVKVTGYYGRVITNGKMTYEQVAMDACKNTTVHKAEMKIASELLLDTIAQRIKEGIIIDLGPLGTLYPAVNGSWKTDPDELSLQDMKPKVNYRPSDDIESAVRGAQLSWTSTDDDDDENATPTDNEQTGEGGDNNGGNGGGGTDLEG